MSGPGATIALARAISEKAELAAADFRAAFEHSRKGKKGNATDTEQDLLRAMLVFAAAGLAQPSSSLRGTLLNRCLIRPRTNKPKKPWKPSLLENCGCGKAG